MLGFDLEPKIVGRESELGTLRTYLEQVMEGHGNAVLISGEAGVGKTRLVNELKRFAESRGFRILAGNGLYGSLTPYMPFMEALRSGGLESLFAEESPRVECVYLVSDTGLLVEEVLREETSLDSNLFASMLKSVSNFVEDSLSMLTGEEKEGVLNTLGYENYRILVQGGVGVNLVVVLTGKENEFLINDIHEVLANVHRHYGSVLGKWDGDKEKIVGITDLLRPLITSGKYDGIYYGLDDPKARRNLLFENISLGMMRHSKPRPTLLCVEDLHWADHSSLALMHYVARNTKRCCLLIVGTYRPEDVTPKEGRPHPLVEIMQLMAREDLFRKVELARLPEQEVRGLTSSLLGKIEFSDDFFKHVYNDTEGNPLFVTELVRMMVQEGTIERVEGIWRMTKNLSEVHIPSKVYDVIVRRLDRLMDEEQRRILDFASVMGDVFTSSVLADSLKAEKVRLLEKLRVLERTHGLIRSRNGTYRFDHAMMREVLYGEIPQELRMEYHALIGDAIEKLGKDDLDAFVGELAFHYSRCRKAEKALHYLIRAASRAKRDFANKEAIRFYMEALEFAKGGEERLEILRNLGEVYDLTGEHERAIESYKEALKLAEDAKTRSAVQARIGDIHRKQGKYDEAIEICTEALKTVSGEECPGEALCLNNIGLAYYQKGDYDKALEFYEKSLAIRERIGDQQGIASSLNNIGLVHNYRGDNVKALEFYEKSKVISEKIGDQRGIAYSLILMGVVHFDRGDYDKALEVHGRSLAIREKIGEQQGIAFSFINLGLVNYQRGDYDKSLEYYQKSLAMSEKMGDQRGIAYSFIHIGLVHYHRGDYEKALQSYETSLAISERIGDQRGIAGSLNNIGSVYFDKGDYDKALQHFEMSLAIGERIGDKRTTTYIYCDLAEVYLKKKDVTKASGFCEKALNLSKEINVRQNVGRSRRILGMICAEQQNWASAIENLQESVTIFENLGMKLELGKSCFESGLMWKRKGEADKARENLNKALEIYHALKSDRHVDQVREALSGLTDV